MPTDTRADTCVFCAQKLPSKSGNVSSVAFADYREVEECEAPHLTKDFLACTREPGHEGDHVACGLQFHEIERWPRDEPTDPPPDAA